jgi:ABC-type methionine transport system permease subunit
VIDPLLPKRSKFGLVSVGIGSLAIVLLIILSTLPARIFNAELQTMENIFLSSAIVHLICFFLGVYALLNDQKENFEVERFWAWFGTILNGFMLTGYIVLAVVINHTLQHLPI